MKKILAAAGAALPGLVCDAAGLVGACALTYGAGLVYLPAGYIVAGAILAGGAWLAARKS